MKQQFCGFVCDQCEEEETDYFSAWWLARSEAKARGWRLGKDGSAVGPKCLEEGFQRAV